MAAYPCEKWLKLLSLWVATVALLGAQLCCASTHWIVTENGRIEQQASSVFILKRPYDLVAFMNKEQKVQQARLKQLEKEQSTSQCRFPQPEKDKHTTFVNGDKHSEWTESFFRLDPLCSQVTKRLSELDLGLSNVNTFSIKGIDIAEHVNFGHATTANWLPLCDDLQTFSLLTYDHLDGVSLRHELPEGVKEPGLLASYTLSIKEWGNSITDALDKNSSSWVVLNLAALYWRAIGNSKHAVKCLRNALYHSPRERRDIALIGLAMVLHHANHTLDSLVLLHASLDITKDLVFHHYLLGVMYAGLEMYDMAEMCFEYVTKFDPKSLPILEILKAVQCEGRFQRFRHEHESCQNKHAAQLGIDETANKHNQFAFYHDFKRQLEELHDAQAKDGKRGSFLINRANPAVKSSETKAKDTKTSSDTTSQNNEKVIHAQKPAGNINIKLRLVEQNTGSPIELRTSEDVAHLKQRESQEKKAAKKAAKKVKEEGASSKKVNSKMKNIKKGDKQKSRGGGESTAKSDAEGGAELSATERTQRQLEHARATLARVRQTMGGNNNMQYGSETERKNEKQVRKPSNKAKGESSKDVVSKPKGASKDKTEVKRKVVVDISTRAGRTKGESGVFVSSGRVFVDHRETRGSPAADTRTKNLKNTAPHDSLVDSSKPSKNPCDTESRKGDRKRRKGDALPRGCFVKTENTQSGDEMYSKLQQNGVEKGVHTQSTLENTTTSNGSENTQGKLETPSQKLSKAEKTKTNPDKNSQGSEDKPDATKVTPQENKTARRVKDSVLSGFKDLRAALSSGGSSEFKADECESVQGIESLLEWNEKFSAWVTLEPKGIDVTKHVNFLEEIKCLPKPPRCEAKIPSGTWNLDHLQGVQKLSKQNLAPETGLLQNLLAQNRYNPAMRVEEIGTRISKALKKDPTSWVLLNMASLYWRVVGEAAGAVRCLRLAIAHSRDKHRDVSLVSLASILFRGGHLKDAAAVCMEALKISPNSVIGHFMLANALVAQSKITEATQHYLIVLQLEPGFVPAVVRLKVIQCIIWRQQQELEKEAEELRKLLTVT